MKTYKPSSIVNKVLRKIEIGSLVVCGLVSGFYLASTLYLDQVIEKVNKTINKAIVQEEYIKACPLTIEECLSFDISNEEVKEIAEGDYKEAIKKIDTPLEASIYLNCLVKYADDMDTYNEEDYMGSFKVIHENKKEDCQGYPSACGGLLSDNGFEPYMICFIDEKAKVGHVVFLYKSKDNYYGTIGKNFSDNTISKDLDELIKDIEEGYNNELEFDAVYDISKEFPDFVDNDKNNDVTGYNKDFSCLNIADKIVFQALKDLIEYPLKTPMLYSFAVAVLSITASGIADSRRYKPKHAYKKRK